MIQACPIRVLPWIFVLLSRQELFFSFPLGLLNLCTKGPGHWGACSCPVEEAHVQDIGMGPMQEGK